MRRRSDAHGRCTHGARLVGELIDEEVEIVEHPMRRERRLHLRVCCPPGELADVHRHCQGGRGGWREREEAEPEVDVIVILVGGRVGKWMSWAGQQEEGGTAKDVAAERG